MFSMTWSIEFQHEFEMEFDAMDAGLQEALLGRLLVLAEFGPGLGRPKVDTLNGSTYANMKELRFDHEGGAWRVAFAFDPNRVGIVLVAGDKAGVNQKKFYKDLIKTADRRYADHVAPSE